MFPRLTFAVPLPFATHLRHCALAATLVGTLATLFAAPADRELGRPHIANFTGRDYHGRPQLYAPTQGPDGLMYFVNWTGVAIYDGQHWERIEVSERPLLCASPAPDGSIYASPIDDIGRVARDNDGRWRYTSFADRLPAALRPLGQVWTIVIHDGDVFFSSSRHWARLPGGDPGRAQFWTAATAAPPRLYRFHDRLYVFENGRGLSRYVDGEFRPFVTDTALADPRVRTLFAGDQDAVWFAYGDGGLFQISAAGTVTPRPHAAGALLAGTLVRTGAALSGGGVALGTAEKGVVVLDAAGQVQFHLHEGTGLDSNVVATAARDREGGVWVSHASGASRLDLAAHVTVFDRTTGLGRNSLNQVLRHRGVLHGAAEDGFYTLCPADLAAGSAARWEKIPTPGNPVRTLAAHGDDLFMGRVATLSRWRGGAIEDLGPLPSRSVNIDTSRADRILVGCETGIVIYGSSAGVWRQTAIVPAITSPVESTVWIEGTDDFWAGTFTQGVFRVHLPGDGSAPVARRLGAIDGLAPSVSHAVLDATPAGIFVRTDDDLFVYDSAGDRFVPNDRLLVADRPLRRASFLIEGGDRVYAQIRPPGAAADVFRLGWFERAADRRRWIWHPLPATLVERLGPRGASANVPLYFDRHDGVNSLWAAGGDALLRITLDQPAGPAPAPPVVLRRADRGGRPLPRDGARPLEFSRQALRFEFACPMFAPGFSARFQTRLLGYDDVWSPPDARHEIEFTNLIGGPFTFEVRAVDADDRPGASTAFVFSVAPPWYRATAAYVLYLLAGAGTVLGLVRWRLRAAERERERLEQLVAVRTSELDAANKAKSLFLANMSHELRTPLNGVIGYAQVLMNDHELSVKSRERLRIVQTSGEHLLRMINEVLDFSKIEAGKIELRPAPFHLPQLLRDLAANFTPRAEEKGLYVRLDFATPLPDLVLGDGQKLRQVLDNLLSNGIKFTAAGGVTLRAAAGAAGASNPVPPLTFSVADTGVGLTPDDRAQLFQPFQQAADGRPPEPGTGLGLAISARLVELMGGTIAVESTPGAGSTFTFAVRLDSVAADAAAPRESAARAIGYRGPRQRVLVVDDVAVNRSVLAELLAPLGFELRTAVDGAEALRLAEEFAPHAAFLDLRMAGMDGFALARALRARTDGTRLKLIAMSASVLSFNRDDAFTAGFDDFLPKPFRESELMEKLGLALRLEWIHAAASEPENPPPTMTVPGGDFAPLSELLACARRGEITAMRDHLRALRSAGAAPAPLLDELDALARSYSMEQIRELLERELAIRTTPPP